MKEIVPIIKSHTKLSPYIFFTELLADIAKAYHSDKPELEFKLFEHGDNYIYGSKYKIDSTTIPLLLSLFEQLKEYYGHAIPLALYNNDATRDALTFLYYSQFFYICGINQNPTFPKGREIVKFNENFLGNLGDPPRLEHRVRAYSLDEENLLTEIKKFEIEDQKRDYLVSHYTKKVTIHFEELLFDNPFTFSFHNTYISLLSELITNGVLHSKSNTFALMFVDRFSTRFSISDNGIGLEESIKTKQPTFFYKPQHLTNTLINLTELKRLETSKKKESNLCAIFETLFYSSVKERKGLFDLLLNVVLNSKGYFRLHTEYCQIIISNRMMVELEDLNFLRKNIINTHNEYSLKLIDEKEYQESIISLAERLQNSFIEFFKKTLRKYNSDVKYSSLRFFDIKFRGVHLEVEIPNA